MNYYMKYIVLFFLVSFTKLFSQQSTDQITEKKYKNISIAFYNIENLFDTIDSPNTIDSEFTPSGSKQWNSEKYYYKLNKLSEVISQLGPNGNPPVVLGLCEVENKEVLEDLVNTEVLKKFNYQIIHYNSPDERGVDVALLYRNKYFFPENSKSLTLTLSDDTAFKTRDMLLVSGKIENESFHFMVAHWPSRRGGEKRSRPKRIEAAKLAKTHIDSILRLNPNHKLIFMGDLNDDPKSISVTRYMQSVHQTEKLTRNNLYNAMYKDYIKGIGTLAWRDTWNLFDQMLLSDNLLKGTFTDYQYYGTRVFNKPFVRQMEGSFKGYPFRTYVGDTFQGGYSDHFGVYIILSKLVD